MRIGLAAAMGLAMASGSAMAQDAKGDWWGLLPAGRGWMRVVVHVTPGAGGLAGTLDSPDQKVAGIALTDVVARDGKLTFAVPTIGGGFAGMWDAKAAAWKGEWRQGGQATPFALQGGKAPDAAPPPTPLPADWAIPSDTAIAALIAARIAPRTGEGIVIGVLDPAGRRIVARGPAGATTFDERTLFEIGSMSKVFTALILADMAAKGEVSLDDPAEKYLPAGATMPARGGRKITLRDLATHMSGLPRLPDNMPFGDPDDPYADYGERLLLDFLAHYQLPRDIGSKFEYSNLGFGLLGYLLARAAHSDYATLVARHVTGPLGMRDTVIALSPDQQARFAKGHDAYMRPTRPWTLPTLAGAGAIRSTADDMLTFVAAVLDPASPIAPAMKLALADRRPIAPGSEIGLAWIVSTPQPGLQLLFHNGGTGGFRSAMLLDPARRRAAVVLTNAAIEPASDDLAMHLLTGSAVLPAGAVPPAPPPVSTHKAISLPPAELDRVIGRYAITGDVVLTVSREGDGLKAQFPGQSPLPIFPEGPLDYFFRAVDAQLRFAADEAGKVAGVTLTQSGRVLQGRRLP